ncbi:TPA: hypothetical protein LUY02_004753 [Enterobacter hormaechei subsp. hoffmannii]|nr:hypothetical protein [Enterobacter hormaechei subsp. hoffmannii]
MQMIKLMSEKPCITPIQIPIKSWGNLVALSCLVTFSPSPLALRNFRSYSCLALSKISKLALAGYNSEGAYSPLRAFFMRNISMRSHVMVKLERDIFGCAGYLHYQSANPFQLCHLNYLAVIGKALFTMKERINHA